MGAIFGASDDDHRFPRIVAMISVACGTFLLLVMLVFLGILGNEWQHLGESSSVGMHPLAHNQFLSSVFFIRNHWTLLVVLTVGIGMALTIVALRTRRVGLVYGLGISSGLAYLLAVSFLTWLMAETLASFYYPFEADPEPPRRATLLTFIVTAAILCVVMWLALMLAMLIVSRIADIGLPLLKDFLWKTAVVVAATSIITIALAMINTWLGFVGGFVAFFALMKKLLDLELLQCVIVVVAVWIVRAVGIFALLGVFAWAVIVVGLLAVIVWIVLYLYRRVKARWSLPPVIPPDAFDVPPTQEPWGE